MKTFTYVEEYLLLLNGNLDPITGKAGYMMFPNASLISLARYDVKVISSMCGSIMDNRPLTDKQGELACKIILKYRRQFANLYRTNGADSIHGIDVSPVEKPRYQLGLRTIDRRRLFYIEKDKIILKFPFEPKLVDAVRDKTKVSSGRWRFINEEKTKHWSIALTEPNFKTCLEFARANEFDIAPEVFDIEKKLLATELYRLDLDHDEEGNPFIHNAPQTILDFVDSRGGMNIDNIINLVDLSTVLHYGVDPKYEKIITKDYSPRVYNLLRQNNIKFAPSLQKSILDDLFIYANITNRFPIYVYEPNLSDELRDTFVYGYFNEDEVLIVPRDNNPIDTAGKKVVYFTKYRATWPDRIPLLVTNAGMMHGAEKTLLLQRAEKVVYFAAEVYNVYTSKDR